MTKWDDDSELYLVTPEEFQRIPDGTELTCIDGSTSIKGKDEIDDDVRFGHMAFGVVDPFNGPLKDLFLVFVLMR